MHLLNGKLYSHGCFEADQRHRGEPGSAVERRERAGRMRGTDRDQPGSGALDLRGHRGHLLRDLGLEPLAPEHAREHELDERRATPC